MSLKQQIHRDIQNIKPVDNLESIHINDALAWVNSGEEIFRIAKPATPPKHLVSYFALVDGDYILLVDHKKAELWLPSGGHVEPNESPKTTVEREIIEELNIKADFIINEPLMVTVTQTVGNTLKHTDVSLWYVVKGDKTQPIKYDEGEFQGVKWFHFDEIPFEKSEPHMKRFIQKLKNLDIN